MAQGHIILIKSDSKDIIMLQKVSISNKRCVMSCIRLLFFSTILWQFGVPTKNIDNCELFS